MGSLSLLQGILLTQELNQGLLHCRQIPYQLSYQGSSDNNNSFECFSGALLLYRFIDDPEVWASLIAQLVKNLPAMQETRLDSWVRKIP